MQKRLAPRDLATRALASTVSTVQQLLGLHTRVIAGRLRTVRAIVPGIRPFHRQQGGELDALRIEMLAMDRCSLEDQIQKGRSNRASTRQTLQ